MSTRPAIGQRESAAAGVRERGARDAFTSGIGVLAATLGSAVGLGNIWKFPYLVGENGGAAFLAVYLLATLLVGLPIMIAEIAIGCRARADAVTSLRRLAPAGQPWWLAGAAGVLSALLILSFYTAVAGWVFAYIAKAALGELRLTDPQQTAAVFDALITSPAQSLLWQWLVLLVVGAIIVAGVSRGIEAATRRLMPALFVLLLLICARSLTLPGAAAGLRFLFVPDFSRLSGAVVLTAMGLAFFKLSVGMGCMITYGSYFRDDQDIPATAARVMLADLLVSLLAGVAIFPAVFAFGFEPGAGPALLFFTIPAVFAGIPFGQVFLVLFFALAAIAATGAMLSLLEVPVAFISERTGLSRLWATALTLALLLVPAATAALSSGLLKDTAPFGKSFFDLYDFLSSNVLLPVGGLALSLFAGWFWGKDAVQRALSNDGRLGNRPVVRAFTLVVRFVTPALVLLVLLSGLGII